MSLLNLFDQVTTGPWITAGKDVQFRVEGDTLVIQCSHGRSDWRYNFMASEDVYKDSDVAFIGHKGFNELWRSIKPIIEGLTFTKILAYSQGSAIGRRVHENYFHRFGFEPEITRLFGEPPSIKNPSEKLQARFTHVVSYHTPRDLVYYLPLILGYRHFGNCVSLTKKAKRPKGYSILQWITDHAPECYRQRLEE